MNGHNKACDHTIGSSGCVCDGIRFPLDEQAAKYLRGYNSGEQMGARPPPDAVVPVMRAIKALVRTGWGIEADHAHLAGFMAMVESKHIICVARVHAGWTHKWQRGPTWTITEGGPFGTLDACMEDLWREVFARYDAGEAAQRENIKHGMLAQKFNRCREVRGLGDMGPIQCQLRAGHGGETHRAVYAVEAKPGKQDFVRHEWRSK